MARPFRIGATGGPGLLLQAGPITPTRRRDVPLSMCAWLVSVDDVLQRHGTPSQTGPASTPEAIQDQQSSGGSLEKYQCTGAPLVNQLSQESPRQVGDEVRINDNLARRAQPTLPRRGRLPGPKIPQIRTFGSEICRVVDPSLLSDGLS